MTPHIMHFTWRPESVSDGFVREAARTQAKWSTGIVALLGGTRLPSVAWIRHLLPASPLLWVCLPIASMRKLDSTNWPILVV